MTSLGNTWADSENIVIVDKIPYYRVKGKSYRDVYKNGLALDQALLMLPCDYSQPIHPVSQIEPVINTVYSTTKYVSHESSYDVFTQKQQKKNFKIFIV